MSGKWPGKPGPIKGFSGYVLRYEATRVRKIPGNALNGPRHKAKLLWGLSVNFEKKHLVGQLRGIRVQHKSSDF